jgi:hypothetical protein
MTGLAELAALAVHVQPPVPVVAESTTVFVHVTNDLHGAHVQEWIDGVLKAWYPAGDDAPADVHVQRPLALEHALAFGRVPSSIELARSTVLVVDPRVRVTYPPLLPQWAGAVLDHDRYEHAAISLQFELEDHPFGALPVAYEFGPDRIVRCGYYRCETPDITIRCTSRDAARYMIGRYSMYEFLGRARLEGDLFKLTVATTLFDNPALRRAGTAVFRTMRAYEDYLRSVVANDWATWGAALARYAGAPDAGARRGQS